MHFDLAAIPQSDAHALLVSAVLPCPIAPATTVDPERCYVATDHGRGWSARSSDRVLMERLGLAEWKDGKR